jgi:molybdenum cofactor guanylyltransferase
MAATGQWSGLGVVLTGGKSRRMGRTKALVEVDGTPMAVRVADAMRAAGCTTVAALGGDPAELGPLHLPVISERGGGAGPLVAIVAALAWAMDRRDQESSDDTDVRGDTDVMVLACDLPFVVAGDLAGLTAAALRRPEADVIVAHTDRLEPGCAIWRTASLRRLEGLVAHGERAVHRAIARLHHVEVEFDRSALRNINTPADLRDYPGRHEW